MGHISGYYAPTRKGNRIICHGRAFNYYDSFSKVRELMTLQEAFSEIETTSGISFGTAMSEYITAAKQLNSRQEKIPSRTVFGKGKHLEIHCFKDKHEYRLSIPAFDAVVAFLTINGEADVAEDILNANLLEAA